MNLTTFHSPSPGCPVRKHGEDWRPATAAYPAVAQAAKDGKPDWLRRSSAWLHHRCPARLSSVAVLLRSVEKRGELHLKNEKTLFVILKMGLSMEYH